jgi:hypothetical protein
MNDIPVATIRINPQSGSIKTRLTDTPTTIDDTLVDDPSMLVDGTGLVGGPNTPTDNIKSGIKPPQLFTKLPRSS